MKKRLIATIIILMVSTISMASDKRPLKDVGVDEFASDTQASPKGSDDNHAALLWWIPNEYWDSVLSRDSNTSASTKKMMLDPLSGVSLLAVVQADISKFGAFKFYSKEEIEKDIKITCICTDGKKHKLSPLKTIDPDLQLVLNTFKPILGSAMGNLGNNMHFFVLNDKSKSQSRLLDPYQKGQIDIQITRKDNLTMDARIELPINALFVPRKCPNGKDAHISWNYCPWSGKRLEE